MSAKNMTASEKIMAQAVSKNVNKLMSDRNITKHKDVYEHIPAFTQSQFSNVINGRTFPTMMQLIGLADFFNVSIDFLLDRNIPDVEKEMSITECCESLAKILSGRYNARLKTIEVTEYESTPYTYIEDYPYPHECKDYDIKEYVNTYQAIYFSEEPTDSTEQPRPDHNAYAINKFLKRTININAMHNRGDLDKEDYNYLLQKYLQNINVISYNKIPFDDKLPFT